MSKKTNIWHKAGVCKAVVENLKQCGIQPKRREYLESVEDVDKAYIIANRYIRNYIPLNDKKVKIEFWKEVKRLEKYYQKNGGKWLDIEKCEVIEEVKDEKYDNVIIDESDETFVSKILEADNSIEILKNSEQFEVIGENDCHFDGISLIKSAVKKGVNRFSKKFLDLIGIDKELVGFRDEVEFYYCKSVNCIFETI